jgi:hypothetical protein
MDDVIVCAECGLPQIDKAETYACQCGFCELCGAVGEATVVSGDPPTEMCAACAMGD